MQQSLAQQQEWHGRARQHASARQHLLGLEWKVLSSELAKLEVDIGESKLKSACLTMKSAALDDLDVETFGRLWSQPGFRSSEAMAIRRADVGSAPAYTRTPEVGPPMWERPEPTMPD